MAAIAGESEELQQPATVGVDIDTVRSQLDDYKVCVCWGGCLWYLCVCVCVVCMCAFLY